jgi:integrase
MIPDDRFDRVPDGQTNAIPWAQFRDEILKLYQPPLCAKATRARTILILRELEACGVETTADLTCPTVAAFCAARPPGQSPYTLHSMLASLRALCSYAEMSGYLRVSPFRLRKMNRWVKLTPLVGKRHYSKDEIKRVLALAAKDVAERTGWAQWRARRLQVTLNIIAYTGMRKTECLRLHVADVDLAARAIWIRPHGATLKTFASQAPVPIPGALTPVIVSWLEHRMDGPAGMELPAECPWLIPTADRKSCWVSGQPGGKSLDRLRALAKRAGVPDMTWKGLRASLASHMEPFAGPAAIQRILRHTSVKTSEQHYRKADIPNLVMLMDGFSYE